MNKIDKDALLGLTSRQAEKNLREYGENVLKGGKKVRAGKILASQFKDVLTMILLFSTILSVVMGDITEAFTIMAIVFLNALLGFLQEYKTEKTIAALRQMAAPTCTALRDGKPKQIPASEVTIGDIILLEEGDKIPADGILSECYGLCADEALLTGESVPVHKKPFSFGNAPHEAQNEVYMGTVVTKGRGRMLVTATGMNTQMGEIAGMLGNIEEEQTPLQKKLDQLGKYIAIGCLAICAVVSVTGILRGEAVFDMLLTGISLSVAAVPEGLSAIVTIVLALAVGRMVKRQALIRKLYSVETLGCADVICTDKTGTLTENKMTVKKIAALSFSVDVSGNGYEMDGGFTSSGNPVVPTRSPLMRTILDSFVLCSNAAVLEQKAQKRGGMELSVSGDPTEAALVIAAKKAGITREELEHSLQKVGEIPFDSERKCMSVLYADAQGRITMFTKGAPDILLQKCSYTMIDGKTVPLTASHRQKILSQNEEMAKNALRVLAFACKTAASPQEPENGLVYLGLCGMMDPPRKEVFSSVRECRRAGIRPVMITGDHKTTAAAIAQEIGILRPGERVVSGAELDEMSDSQLAAEISNISVFARVSPSHKLRIVRAFKRAGHIVAMTGDGVNDAPAIKEADIGVSMGISGTDVTKEASSVILLDDNFSTLVSAIEEGRIIYRNIRKFIRYLLSCNIGEVLTMFLGMLIGLPVVLLPIHILIVNLVTDGLPAIALGLEPGDNDIMREKPRRREDSIFAGGLATTIIFRGCMIGLTTLAVFVAIFKMTHNVDAARTASLLALVFTQLIHVFECKSEKKSLFQINPFDNVKLIFAVLVSGAIVFAVVYFPALSAIFRTVPLTLPQLGVTFAYIAAVPLLVALFSLKKRRPKKQSAIEDVDALSQGR